MPQMLRYQAFQRMVPVVGLEPTRCRHRRILNPLRLPFHHTGTFYRETPKILIGENKERTHYKSYILLYLGSLEKSRFLSDFILPDLLAFESASSTNSNTPAREKKDFIYYIGSAGKKQARSAKKCALVRFFRKPEMCLSLADRKNRNILHFIHFAEMIFWRIVHSVQKTQPFSVQCHKIGGQRTIFG